MQSPDNGDSYFFPSDEDSQSSDLSGPAKSATRYGGSSQDFCSGSLWFSGFDCLVLHFPDALLGNMGTSGYLSLLDKPCLVWETGSSGCL